MYPIKKLNVFGIMLAGIGILLISWGSAGWCSEKFVTGKVTQVIDGDTIEINNRYTVRYIGINTPEISTPSKKGEPFGKEALRYNRELVQGKTVQIQFGKEKKDQYDRTLAFVYLEDGTFVNARLIEDGMAYCLYYQDNSKHANEFVSLQRKAIQEQKGLWNNYPFKTERVIGNKRSRRFHSLECDLGSKTSHANRVVFHDEKEAFLKGYSPSKKCSAD